MAPGEGAWGPQGTDTREPGWQCAQQRGLWEHLVPSEGSGKAAWRRGAALGGGAERDIGGRGGRVEGLPSSRTI